MKKNQMFKENDGNGIFSKFLKRKWILTYEDDHIPLPHKRVGGQMESHGS